LEGPGGEKGDILYPLAKPGLRIRTRHWIRNHIFHTSRVSSLAEMKVWIYEQKILHRNRTGNGTQNSELQASVMTPRLPGPSAISV